jgi:glycosyltransferase involved in cell wall biosynthesis
VLPSLRESGGNALLEAMATGLPIITVNWGGPGEYITDECGIRVNPSTPEAFVADMGKAMVRLAQDKELRRQMGEAGTRRVRTCYFDWDAKTGKILDILHDILRS